MQSANGSQFLNITPSSLSSARFALSSAPAPVIVIVIVCMHHYNYINLTSALRF